MIRGEVFQYLTGAAKSIVSIARVIPEKFSRIYYIDVIRTS
jgi:hypothetical protein